jgi:major membrane immunogen (membrane-anchored lipoprotein)
MKNKKILLAILVIALVFGMTACSNGGGGGSPDSTSATYTYGDDAGNNYKLEITKAGRAAYTPKKGDNYVLIITFTDGKTEKSTGTVTDFSNNQFNLKSSDNKEFSVRVEGDKIAGIEGSNLPFELPQAKSVTINSFTIWQGNPANNGGNYYNLYGVFLIKDLNELYDEWFPIVDALYYATVQSNSNVKFDLIIPVDNTWNYGRMPWTGKGDYYVVIVPCESPNFYANEAKIYKESGSPAKVSFNSQSTTLEFNKFADWGKY